MRRDKKRFTLPALRQTTTVSTVVARDKPPAKFRSLGLSVYQVRISSPWLSSRVFVVAANNQTGEYRRKQDEAIHSHGGGSETAVEPKNFNSVLTYVMPGLLVISYRVSSGNLHDGIYDTLFLDSTNNDNPHERNASDLRGFETSQEGYYRATQKQERRKGVSWRGNLHCPPPVRRSLLSIWHM